MDLASLSGIGTELGLFNTALITLAGSFFVYLVKNLGPPWKWGKAIKEMEELRKSLMGDNPGGNNKVTLAEIKKTLDGWHDLCGERHKNIDSDINEIKTSLIAHDERIRDLEKGN